MTVELTAGGQAAGAAAGISRRSLLRMGMAALGAASMGLAGAGSAVGRELLVDSDDPGGNGTPSELRRLLRYLGVDYTVFEIHEARYFAALGAMLARHGIVWPEGSLNRSNFREAVGRFQRARSLPEDGLPDGETLWQMQAGWAGSRQLDLVRIEADLWPGREGFRTTLLRQDAAAAYNRLRKAVKDLGGVVTSDGSIRDLSAAVSAGRSPRSLHYTGLAFDMALSTGMQNSQTDPYLLTREGPGWRVWARAAGGAERTLDAVLWSKGQTRVERVMARVIDFTAMARQFGFQNISQQDCFPGTYACAEWWHFQYEAALVPFLSQFGAELLSLGRYPESTLKANGPIWQNRKALARLAHCGEGTEPARPADGGSPEEPVSWGGCTTLTWLDA